MPLNATIRLGKFPGGAGLGAAFSPAAFVQVLNGVAALQHAKIVKAFREGGHHTRGGSRWAPWSPTYAAGRRKTGRTKVLVDTGRLRNTIRANVQTGEDGGHAILLTSDAPYAAFHQFGTRVLPPRPVIEITDSDVADAARMVGVLAGRLLNGKG